jgi:exosortase
MTDHGTRARTICFGLLFGLTLAVFSTHLLRLVRFGLQADQYSHIMLVPLISAALFLMERERIFSHVETRWGMGLGLLFAGIVFNWIGFRHSASLSENDRLAIAIFSLVVIFIGEFVLCYGARALRTSLFPVLFLFLMVPIPDFLLDRVIYWLQTWSADASYAVFELVGVPVLRTGLFFSLPGFTVEVAKECSGIRSSLVLLITSLLAGHLFLRSAWTKTVLTLVTVPLFIIKNTIRIVTISLLSAYVDPSFLTGSLHRQGGPLFFSLALVILAPIVWLLKKSERMVTSRAEAL